LYVTKDISLAVIPPSGGSGYITIDQVEQSFHQVPEPTTTGCFCLAWVPWFVANALSKSDAPDPAQHLKCNNIQNVINQLKS